MLIIELKFGETIINGASPKLNKINAFFMLNKNPSIDTYNENKKTAIRNHPIIMKLAIERSLMYSAEYTDNKRNLFVLLNLCVFY